MSYRLILGTAATRNLLLLQITIFSWCRIHHTSEGLLDGDEILSTNISFLTPRDSDKHSREWQGKGQGAEFQGRQIGWGIKTLERLWSLKYYMHASINIIFLMSLSYARSLLPRDVAIMIETPSIKMETDLIDKRMLFRNQDHQMSPLACQRRFSLFSLERLGTIWNLFYAPQEFLYVHVFIHSCN